MDDNSIKKLLKRVKKRTYNRKALQSFKDMPYKDLEFAKVDIHRLYAAGFLK